MPGTGYILKTVGVAQFRTGDHRRAVETRRRADALNGGVPSDVAFLAMARYRLGERVAADLDYARLQKLMQDGKHASDEESVAFLRETEALFGK